MKKTIQKRKQRKFYFTAPMHKRKKMVSAHISKELRKKLSTGKRSIPVRKGDKVKILRGQRKGHVGKIVEVCLSDRKIYMEGVVQRNSKGIEKPIPVEPSNVMIMEADFSKDRQKILDRCKKGNNDGIKKEVEEKKAGK